MDVKKLSKTELKKLASPSKSIKAVRVSSNRFEYWIEHQPLGIKDIKIIVEADTWKEADKQFKLLIKVIRNKKIFYG